MTWLISGSTAIYHWFPDFPRNPVDLDLLSPAAPKFVHSELFIDVDWHEAAELMLNRNVDPVFLDPDLLFTVKVSHAHWDVKWQKTMFDVNFLKNKGCKLNYLIYDALFKVWTQVHGRKNVNMNRKMEEFFDDAVVRTYGHEWLHELVAFNGRPMHEQLRPDHGTAWCSQEKFLELSDEDQFKTALEEILVVAIERGKLSPTSNKIDRLRAVHRAYFKLVTSMTTGWFARFLILNQVTLLTQRKELWQTQLNKTLVNMSST